MQPLRCTASVFIATSLDGFISKMDGSVDWLNELHSTMPMPPGDDGGFSEFLHSVDAIVMGRKTYNSVLSLTDDGKTWPYGAKPIAVMTRKSADGLNIPEPLSKLITVMSSSTTDDGDNQNDNTANTPRSVLNWLEEKYGAKDVYVDGGETIRAFFDSGLVERVILTVVPVKLGDGRTLFTQAQKQLLQPLSVEKNENGFVKTTYEVKGKKEERDL